MGWLVLGGILLFIALLLVTRIRIFFSYSDKILLYVKILFLKINILPGKSRKPKLRNFKIKRYRKRRIKEIKKAQRDSKKKKDREKKHAKPEKEEEGPKPSLADNVRYIINLIRHVLFLVLKKLIGYIRIDIERLHITVGTGDAAKTAVNYGLISQSVSYLLELLSQNTHCRTGTPGSISVNPDFIAEKTTADVSLSVSIRIWQIFALAFKALAAFLKVHR